MIKLLFAEVFLVFAFLFSELCIEYKALLCSDVFLDFFDSSLSGLLLAYTFFGFGQGSLFFLLSFLELFFISRYEARPDVFDGK